MSESQSAVDRRSSKRVANAANGKKQRQEKSKKIKNVDFNKLEMSSLLRYKRFFKLTTSTSASKSEHISVIRRHFVNHPRLRDVEVISGFLYANNQHKLQNKQAIAQALQAQQEFKNAQAAAAAAAAAAAQTRAQIQADAEDERMWAEQNPQAAQQKQE